MFSPLLLRWLRLFGTNLTNTARSDIGGIHRGSGDSFTEISSTARSDRRRLPIVTLVEVAALRHECPDRFADLAFFRILDIHDQRRQASQSPTIIAGRSSSYQRPTFEESQPITPRTCQSLARSHTSADSTGNQVFSEQSGTPPGLTAGMHGCSGYYVIEVLNTARPDIAAAWVLQKLSHRIPECIDQVP